MSNMRLKDHTWDAANVYDANLGKTQEEINAEGGGGGTPGEDGFSPAVTILPITGGHRINITDKTHPQGQNFNVMDGADGAEGEPAPSSAVTPAVTAWLAEHIAQETGYVIDDSLSVSGAAADAKATGDEIGGLKLDIGSLEKKSIPAMTIEQGGISGSTGEPATAAASLRLRTANFIKNVVGGKIKVHVADGWGVDIFQYNANDGTEYLDHLLVYADTILDIPCLYLKFVFRKENNDPITPSDLPAIDFITFLERFSYDLYPTGNADNRSTEIVAYLLDKGVCRLAPGNYYVDNFVMPAGSSLIGAGAGSTTLMFSDAAAPGEDPAWYAIRMRSNTTLANLTLDGGANSTPVENYAGNNHVHGIRIGGEGGSSSYDTNDIECTIENVIVDHFPNGCGIFCRHSNQASQGGSFKNVRVRNCSAGFYFGEHAEYFTLTGCYANDCYTGLVNIGGNNIISGCVFGRNEIGINMPGPDEDGYGGSRNSAHGIITGCKITHCGRITQTDGYGIKSIGQTGNMLFSGCMFGYPLYFKDRGAGLMFSGCTIKGNHYITVDHCAVNIFSTMFEADDAPPDPQHPEIPRVIILNNGVLRRRDCIVFNGTELRDVPEPEPENNG